MTIGFGIECLLDFQVDEALLTDVAYGVECKHGGLLDRISGRVICVVLNDEAHKVASE